MGGIGQLKFDSLAFTIFWLSFTGVLTPFSSLPIKFASVKQFCSVEQLFPSLFEGVKTTSLFSPNELINLCGVKTF